MAVFDPKNLRTAEDAQRFMNNARRLGNEDAYRAAFRRFCDLKGLEGDTDLLRDVWRAIAAFEQLRSEKNGKRTLASRTRQKLARDGAIKLVEDLALRNEASPGFLTLTEGGLGDLTFEYLLLKHSDLFSEEARSAARSRLVSAGVDLPSN